MACEWINCEQGTADWFEARRGIPTASEFAAVLAKGEGKTRKSYLYRLAGEIITGEVAETYQNAAMERGKEWESEARAEYEFLTDATVEQVGFARLGRAGASPDGLIGADGLIEIKTKAPHLLIECIERGYLPPEHKAQVHGALWITGRAWCDFVAWWPKMPLFVARVTRDEEYITKLAAEVERFNAELDAVVTTIRNYRIAA